MKHPLTQRKASLSDLHTIIALLLEDELGQTRERLTPILDPRYIDAFHLIDSDPHQYLMVVEQDSEIVGTCHLTFMPSLTCIGSSRMQIEAVRVSEKCRGQGIGEWMIKAACAEAALKGAKMIQLTTNKKRTRAKKFYEGLGFEATHEGLKLFI